MLRGMHLPVRGDSHALQLQEEPQQRAAAESDGTAQAIDLGVQIEPGALAARERGFRLLALLGREPQHVEDALRGLNLVPRHDAVGLGQRAHHGERGIEKPALGPLHPASEERNQRPLHAVADQRPDHEPLESANQKPDEGKGDDYDTHRSGA
jgi:hypothetical protein